MGYMARLWKLRTAVLAGGFVGSLARYAFQSGADSGVFPWGTLIANVLGSLLLGILTSRIGRSRKPELLAALLGVGAIGGFTTFSAFIGQMAGMSVARAVAYALITVVLGLVAGVVGIHVGKVRS